MDSVENFKEKSFKHSHIIKEEELERDDFDEESKHKEYKKNL